jgi:hypothetical protein
MMVSGLVRAWRLPYIAAGILLEIRCLYLELCISKLQIHICNHSHV